MQRRAVDADRAVPEQQLPVQQEGGTHEERRREAQLCSAVGGNEDLDLQTRLGQGPAGLDRALHGVDLDVVDPHDAQREVVMGADDPGAYDVVKPLRAGVAQFVVEVRPHRRAAVARITDHVALLHGPGVGAEPEVYAVRAAGVALFAHALLDVLAEALQVAVYGGRAVVQREVDGAPVAVGAQAYARDVAVGHGHEGFALGTVGFDVDARVEMRWAHLAEIGRVEPFDVADRVYVLLRGGMLSPGPEAGGGQYQQCQNSSHVSVSVTSPRDRQKSRMPSSA